MKKLWVQQISKHRILDKLAAEGTIFSNAYTMASMCGPSHGHTKRTTNWIVYTQSVGQRYKAKDNGMNLMRTHILTLGQFLLMSLLVAGSLNAADPDKKIEPRPNDLVYKESLKQLTGDFKGAKLSRDVRILWLSGPEDHGGGSHDYIRVKELFVPMLQSIPRITVEAAFSFPTQKQFDKADLLIQYLHLPNLTAEQFAMYQNFVDRGGRVVSIHESCIMRPIKRAKKLASCIGCSWKGKASMWSKFAHGHRLHLDTEHPAFSGLPASVQFNDESYWNLLAHEGVKVIGAIAPADGKKQSFNKVLELPNVRGHAFWTYTPGKAKVFGTTTGHYTYMFYDPLYRLILLRGIAWAIDEDPAPFMPLVFHGITNEKGFVGTTDSMMNYKNRKH
jgi:type 1 glutamine amidotransferase